jgi:radical SAM-linked protein
MNDTLPIRFRISYWKGPAMRYTGHLDLQRTWERTFRRAGLPLAYTQGYNPRPRLQLSPALPLGCTSECELIDIWLETPLAPDEILTRLKDSAPPGISLSDAQPVPANDPALQNQVTSVEYRASLPDRLTEADLHASVEQLLQADSIQRSRRGKSYDLRPLVESLVLMSGGSAGRESLEMTLASREGATGRPEEVLLELGLDPAECLIQRTRLLRPPPQESQAN